MAISVTSTAIGYSAAAVSSIQPFFSQNHGNGSCNIVFCGAQSSGNAPSSVTDTAGNTYYRIDGVQQGVNYMYMYIAYNIVGNGSNIIDVTWPGSYAYNIVVCWNITGNFGTLNPLCDYSNSNGTLTTGTLDLTAGRNAAIFYGAECDNQDFAVGSGFTGGRTLNDYFGYQYKANITSSQTASASGTGNRSCVALMIEELRTDEPSFLAGYEKRKSIYISADTHIGETLTDFPVYVPLDADANVGADIDTDGYNIRFTTVDGSTTLKYERNNFIVSSGEASGEFYVKTTLSPITYTEIFMYYKASSPTDGADPTNAWNSDYRFVYHMNQDPAGAPGTIQDSTSNNLDSASYNMSSGALETVGVGKGLHFDASDDWLETYDTTDPTAYTIEALVKPDSNPRQTIIYRTLSDNTGWSHQIHMNDSATWCGYTYDNVMAHTATGYTTGSSSRYDHLVSTAYNGGPLTLYVNGTLEASTGTMSNLWPDGDRYRIARSGNGFSGNYFDGIIDEIRVSNIVRSSGWIRFTSYNLRSTTNELVFGMEENSGPIYIPHQLFFVRKQSVYQR